MSGLLDSMEILLRGSRELATANEVAPKRRTAPGGSGNPGQSDHRKVVKDLLFADTQPEDLRLEDKYTHVSSLLSGCCPRAYALMLKFGNTEKKVPVMSGMRLIWALGIAAERHAVDSLVRVVPERVFGKWLCECGRHDRHEWLQVSGAVAGKKKCPECGKTGKYQYRQSTFLCDEYGVSGSPDLLMLSEDESFFFPVEFKSINEKGFTELDFSRRPKTDHALQVLYYRRLMKRAGWTVTDFAVVVYIAKEYKWGRNPYREFVVNESDEQYRVSLDLMDREAMCIQNIRKHPKGKLPSRLRLCARPDTQRVKDCPCGTVCFSMS